MSLFDGSNAKKIATHYSNGVISEKEFIEKAIPILKRNENNLTIIQILAEGMMNAVLSNEDLESDEPYIWALKNGNGLFKQKFMKKVDFVFYNKYKLIFNEELFPELKNPYKFNAMHDNGLIDIENTYKDAIIHDAIEIFLDNIAQIDLVKTITLEDGTVREVPIFNKSSIPIICNLIKKEQNNIPIELYIKMFNHGYKPTILSINSEIVENIKKNFLCEEIWYKFNLLDIMDFLLNEDESFTSEVIKSFLMTDLLSVKMKNDEVEKLFNLLETNKKDEKIGYFLSLIYHYLVMDFDIISDETTYTLMNTAVREHWTNIYPLFLNNEVFSDYDVLCTYLDLINHKEDEEVFAFALHKYFNHTYKSSNIINYDMYKKFLQTIVSNKKIMESLNSEDISKLLLNDERELRKIFEETFPGSLNFFNYVANDYTPVTHNVLAQILLTLDKNNALDTNNQFGTHLDSIEDNIKSEAIKRSIEELLMDEEALNDELAREDSIFKNDFVANLTCVKIFFESREIEKQKMNQIKTNEMNPNNLFEEDIEENVLEVATEEKTPEVIDKEEFFNQFQAFKKATGISNPETFFEEYTNFINKKGN